MLHNEENAQLLAITLRVKGKFPTALGTEIAEGVRIFWQRHKTARQVQGSVKLLLAHFKSLCSTTLRRDSGSGSNNIHALQQAAHKPIEDCDVREQKLRLILVIKELLQGKPNMKKLLRAKPLPPPAATL